MELSKILNDIETSYKSYRTLIKNRDFIVSKHLDGKLDMNMLNTSQKAALEEMVTDGDGFFEKTEIYEALDKEVLEVKDWRWFDLGEYHTFSELMPYDLVCSTDEVEQLPFEHVAITANYVELDKKQQFVWFCKRTEQGFSLLWGLQSVKGQMNLIPTRCDYKKGELNGKLNWAIKFEDYAVGLEGEDKSELIRIESIAPLVLLKLLKCNNVQTEKRAFPPKLNKRRAKKGARLGYDCHILTIKGSSSSGDGGGTHSSPRLHFRRGHVRRLPKGTLTWVRECMVGKDTMGTVDKSYKVAV